MKKKQKLCEINDCNEVAVGRWVSKLEKDSETMELYVCAKDAKRGPGRSWRFKASVWCTCACGDVHDRNA